MSHPHDCHGCPECSPRLRALEWMTPEEYANWLQETQQELRRQFSSRAASKGRVFRTSNHHRSTLQNNHKEDPMKDTLSPAEERRLFTEIGGLAGERGGRFLAQLARGEHVRDLVAEQGDDTDTLIETVSLAPGLARQFSIAELRRLAPNTLRTLATAARDEIVQRAEARAAGFPEYVPPPDSYAIAAARRELRRR